MFELNADEFAALRLQFATSNDANSARTGRGVRRNAPLAFTQHGAIMASMVLNSPRATELSVYVERAFVPLNALLAATNQSANSWSSNANCWPPRTRSLPSQQKDPLVSSRLTSAGQYTQDLLPTNDGTGLFEPTRFGQLLLEHGM